MRRRHHHPKLVIDNEEAAPWEASPFAKRNARLAPSQGGEPPRPLRKAIEMLVNIPSAGDTLCRLLETIS